MPFFSSASCRARLLSHRGQHAHVIGRRPLHTKELAATPRKILPPPTTMASCTSSRRWTDFFGHVFEHVGADAEALITHQGFTTELEQNPFIFGRHPHSSPIWNRQTA
jgi:hypothetical protein